MRNFRSQVQKQCKSEFFFFFLYVGYRIDLWIKASSKETPSLISSSEYRFPDFYFPASHIGFFPYLIYLKMPSPSVLLIQIIGTFAIVRSVLDEAAYESCKWKVLDMILQHQSLDTLILQLKKEHYLPLVEKNMTFQTPDQLLSGLIPTEDAFHKFNQHSSCDLVSVSHK